MAITLTSTYSTLSLLERTNSIISCPSGVQDGDFLLSALLTFRSTDISVTLPSGWSLIIDDETTNFVGRTVIAYKIASSEGSDWTWTHNTATTVGLVWRIPGVISSGNPLDSTVSSTYDAGGYEGSWGTITTSTNNSAIIGIRSGRQEGGYLISSDLTIRINSVGTIMACGDIQASSGSSGTKEWTENGDNDSMMFLFALKEQVASATGLPRRALNGPFYGSLRGSVI